MALKDKNFELAKVLVDELEEIIKLAVTAIAVNRITSRGKFFEGKLAGICTYSIPTVGAGWVFGRVETSAD